MTVEKRMIEALKEIASLNPLLVEFQTESNRIERIYKTSSAEIEALSAFIKLEKVTVGDLVAYVSVVAPHAQLRDNPSVPGVRVGNHVAPQSGPIAMSMLDSLLSVVSRVGFSYMTPHEVYCEYEYIHPFTDGNGRSGRALWLWMHKGKAPHGFLNGFHYETLEAFEKKYNK